MAPTPFRRRRKATRLARNLALAEAALALAKDRAGSGASAVKGRGKLVAAGGAAVVVGVVAVLKRDKVARALPSRSGDGRRPGERARAAPAVELRRPGPRGQHRDADPGAGPGHPPPTRDAEASTEGDLPSRPAIDERAEEEAAAAEAAAIGGGPTNYAGVSLDEPADEAERPVVEAGGGESEGQEQAEAELLENATVRDQAPSDAERQIEDAIEAQDEPASGETPEPLAPGDDPLRDAVPEGGVGAEGGGISGRPGARLDDAGETPGLPATGSPATEPQTGDDEARN